MKTKSIIIACVLCTSANASPNPHEYTVATKWVHAGAAAGRINVWIITYTTFVCPYWFLCWR